MNSVHRSMLVAVRAALPLALRGRPGVGKTSMVEAMAEASGMHLEVVVGSLREPTDLVGLPIVRPDGGIDLAAPRWALRANEATDGAVILFDELTTASPATQAAMLRVIRERIVGDLRLADHVRIVAAYNDAGDCGGYDLELPMRSRFLHLVVEPDVDEFCTGLLNGWTTPDLAPVDGTSAARNWSSLVAGFLRARPGLLEAPPEMGSSGGYPTPRTWELVVLATEAADRYGEGDDVRDLLIAGCVGAGAAAELLAFVNNLDLPDPNELLVSPDTAKDYLEASRPDRVLVLLDGLARAATVTVDPILWSNSWRVAELAVQAGFGDLVAWTFRPVAACRPEGALIPPSFSTVRQFLERAA